ncbi:MAG: hypothetical protein [Caudoviricetes sp.]|nr:MAG: hypothetical protein [Caudoviricetes sp.]
MNNLSIKGVANAFLHRSFNEKNFVTPMKLQKLTFLAYGYYLTAIEKLGETEKPLITERMERFQAWPYGPVSPCLYDEFKEFGGNVITRVATYPTPQNGRINYTPVPSADDNDPLLKLIIDYVWTTYKSWNAYQLSELSHQSGWAWERIRQAFPGFQNTDIPDSYIREDFKPLVNGGTTN